MSNVIGGFKVGNGLKIDSYNYDDNVTIMVDRDMINTCIDVNSLYIQGKTFGKMQILVSDGNNELKFVDPLQAFGTTFFGNHELRENNEALAHAWGVLLDALHQYLIVEKMVGDESQQNNNEV